MARETDVRIRFSDTGARQTWLNTKAVLMDNFKEIAEFIKAHLMGCKFVGISSDREVFVQFEYDDPEMQNGAALRIGREFTYISKVTVVVQPSIATVTKMVDELNAFLEDTPPKRDDLLEIGSF